MLNLKEFVMWGLLVLAGLGLVYAKGRSDENTQWTIKSQTEQLAAVRQLEVERETTQRALADLSNNWQAHLAASKASTNRTVNALRSDGIRLSVALADETVRCVTGDGRPLSDGRAELRTDSSEFLIGEAKRADAQVTYLQGVVRTLQGEPNESTKGR
jgi:hypothetical protein